MQKQKKILLVRTAETFMANAIKNSLLGVDFIVAEANYSATEIKENIRDVCLIVLYTDSDIVKQHEAFVYLKDLCVDQNKVVLIIGEDEAFKFAHQYIPKEDIAFEIYRPLDMSDLMAKVMIATDDEFEQQRRKCILIIDDDLTFLQMMREILKDTYRVGMANSGTQAVAWLANNKADLILLDYDMPILDGPKVMEMLKSESFSRSTPVMFLTGKSDRESVTNVLSLKPVDYLLKSITKEKLLKTLADFFDSRKGM